MKTNFAFKVELSVLEHLGTGLYASTPSILTEIIANAWDADAKEVRVTLDEANDRIEIADDGHGMAAKDVSDKFLTVGYSRRDQTRGGKSDSGKRDVMGRKGIGKLAMFSLADNIEVSTKKRNQPQVGFVVKVPELRRKAKQNKPYPMEAKKLNPISGTGTRFVLSKLNSGITKTESYLRRRLARRFAVLGPAHGFKVMLGEPGQLVEVTRRDVGIWGNIQFLFYFDEDSKTEIEALSHSIAKLPMPPRSRCTKRLDDIIDVDGSKYRVRGIIVSVQEPKQLGVHDENINHISVFARGRLFQEDILAEVKDARHFNSYLYGEVHADFLDSDGVDRATSGREAIRKDDKLVHALRSHMSDVLSVIRDQWDEWRIALGYEETEAPNTVIKEWLEGLPAGAVRKAADRLMTSISNAKFSNNPDQDTRTRVSIQRSTIMGFEKLRVTDQVDKLERITDVFSPEFQDLMAQVDRVEEVYFHDISRQRMAVIEKLEQHVEEESLEKIVQDLLVTHLWLVDPSWERVSGTTMYEQTLTKFLKEKCPDERKGARLDIAYRQDTGRHRIIELKRPGITPTVSKILEQGDKYRRAFQAYLKSNRVALGDPSSRSAAVEILFLLSDMEHLDETHLRTLEAGSIRVATYGTLISGARKAYSAYYDERAKAGKLQALLDRLK